MTEPVSFCMGEWLILQTHICHFLNFQKQQHFSIKQFFSKIKLLTPHIKPTHTHNFNIGTAFVGRLILGQARY